MSYLQFPLKKEPTMYGITVRDRASSTVTSAPIIRAQPKKIKVEVKKELEEPVFF